MTDRDFEKRLTTLYPALMQFSRNLTRHKERAEDLLQDGMLRMWKSREKYKEDTNFPGWCKTVIRNLYLNQVQVEARMPMKWNNDFLTQEVTGEREGTSSAGYSELVSRYAAVRENQEDEFLENQIYEVIATMPSHTALLIHLKIQGLTYTQICNLLGITANNAKQRYFHDIKVLRKKLLAAGLVDADLHLPNTEEDEPETE